MGQPNQNKTNQNHNGIMASIKPLGQRVLVKRLDAEEVSAGGIVLPDTAQEKPQEAEVVALGTGGKDERKRYPILGRGGQQSPHLEIRGNGRQSRWSRSPHHQRGRHPRGDRGLTPVLGIAPQQGGVSRLNTL